MKLNQIVKLEVPNILTEEWKGIPVVANFATTATGRKTIYHLGASLKDLGKKCFAFSILNLEVQDILCKLEKNLIK